MVGKRVKRVVIEYVTPESIMYELTDADGRHGRAVGIDYTSDTISCQGQGANDELVTAKATKLVVVSSGAFGSPAILERSGIGAPSVLERNNIRVLVDLPGVGENYKGMFCTPEGPCFAKTDVILQTIWPFVQHFTHQRRLKPWMMFGATHKQSLVSGSFHLGIQCLV